MGSPETPYHREPGYAERYRDQRFQTGSGARTHDREAKAIEHLLSLLPRVDAAPEPGPWLDVPCGAGRLCELLPGPAVLVDRDLEMVRAAPPDRPRVCASVHELPFTDGSFTGALCMRLLHHIETGKERRRILGELRRVSGGPLVVSFFHAFSLQHLRRIVSRMLGGKRSGRCATSFRSFCADLEAAGFEVWATRPLARFISEQWIVLARPKDPPTA